MLSWQLLSELQTLLIWRGSWRMIDQYLCNPRTKLPQTNANWDPSLHDAGQKVVEESIKSDENEIHIPKESDIPAV